MIDNFEAGESCTVERVDLAGETADLSDSPLLSDHTTLRVGGPAKRFVTAHTEAELVDAVRELDAAGEPVLVLSGGSNLLVGDHGFDGTVVRVATTGIHADVSSCGGALVRVAAGENWDAFVARAVDQEWVGIESLSGIPGLVGSTPIQNVGAYGADVSQTIASVRTLDRSTGEFRTFPLSDCGFGYRTSVFKREPGRYVVLEVSFQFELGSLSAPIRYAELARQLNCEVGDRVDTHLVRDTLLRIRASKGMVLDDADHDTWSAGSFFTNPIITTDAAAELPADAPQFAAGDGLVKTSAAWLIDHAGYGKGYGTTAARLSTKHALAITNRGGASAADIVALAREVRAGVREAYGIELVPEPVFVGVTLG